MATLPITFDKGLNSAVDQWSTPPGHCTTFSDYVLNYGVARPRTSMLQVNQTSLGAGHTIIGIQYLDLGDGTNRGILRICDGTAGNIYISSTGMGAQIYQPVNDGSITFVSSVAGAVTQNIYGPVTFSVLNGITIVAGQSANAFQIIGPVNTATTLPVITNGYSICRTVNNLMFLAGNFYGSTASSTLIWSNVSDPTTYNASSNITFRNNDGEGIVALGEISGNLLIFKKSSIGLLSTQTISISGILTLGPLSTIFQGIGAVGPGSVDNLPDGRCIFISQDMNVYITDGYSLQCLTNNSNGGTNIQSLLQSVASNERFALIKYVPFRKEIVVSIASTTGTYTVIVAYDITQNYWRQITGFTTISSMALAKNLSNNSPFYPSSVLLLGDNNGNIYDFYNGDNGIPTNDSSSVIAPLLETSVLIPPNFFSGSVVMLTIWYKCANSTYFQYQLDDLGYGSAITLPSTSTRVDLKIQLKGLTNYQRPSTFQIKFLGTNGANADGGKIYKVELSDEVSA